jgi:hypothetical protein
MAGYPRSGNLTPKALLRAFDPVAADINKSVGLFGSPALARFFDTPFFDPFWILLPTGTISQFKLK